MSNNVLIISNKSLLEPLRVVGEHLNEDKKETTLDLRELTRVLSHINEGGIAQDSKGGEITKEFILKLIKFYKESQERFKGITIIE